MSIMGRSVPNDSSYPINVLLVLQDVKKWLDEKKKSDEFALVRFKRFLAEAKNEEPFAPGRLDSREPPPNIMPEERFRYRRQVWQFVRDELNVTGGLFRFPFKEQVEYLDEQLDVCFQYAKYQTALERFRTEVEAVELSFRAGPFEGFLDDDVVVLGALQEKGATAHEFATKILNALVSDLLRHISGG